jgi:formylglycine-generating enzyme
MLRNSNILFLLLILICILMNCSNQQTPSESENSIPIKPHTPIPADSTWDITIPVQLAWDCSDEDGDIIYYRIMLGDSDSLAVIVEGLEDNNYLLTDLDPGTRYFWQIEANDQKAAAIGDIWTFSTKAQNLPPGLPHSPTPAHLEENTSITPILNWQGSDPDSDSLLYDLRFGNSDNPQLIALDIVPPYLTHNLSPDSWYFWQVTAKDGEFESPGDIWSFHTGMINLPPYSAYAPCPASGSQNVNVCPVLSWSGYDPDGDVLFYDVYIGDALSLQLVAEQIISNSFSPQVLDYDHLYYWRIDCSDGFDATEGLLWSFRTREENLPPIPPHSPSPAHLQIQVSQNSSLNWNCSDPNADTLRFDVFLADNDHPELAVSNINQFSWTPEELAPATDYWWKIVAKDYEYQTASPLWHFTTAGGNLPPAQPFSPQPPDNSTQIHPATSFSWQCYDPDGDQLYFDVYLGITSSPPLVENQITEFEYTPPQNLQENSLYFWQIIASDGELISPSSIFVFYTGEISQNQPPQQAIAIFPLHNAQYVAQNSHLSWQCYDPDEDVLHYDIYFGIDENPGLVEQNFPLTFFDPAGLLYDTTYYWRIDAKDFQYITTGDIWSFTTELENIQVEMIEVTGALFNMGDTRDLGDYHELPIHSVQLSDFLISKYEISQAEWQFVMDSNPAQGSSAGSNYPVYNVSWIDALQFCNLLSILEGYTPCYQIDGINSTCDFEANGYRLPTEAEWEWAARGASDPPDFLYAGADLVHTVAVYIYDNPGSCDVVGTKNPNELELYDVSGNVWEWCWDFYGSDYYSWCYEQGTVINPTGPEDGIYRIIRGGGWSSTAHFCRVATRHTYYPLSTGDTIGFRICRYPR